LTNVALLFSIFPEVASWIKGLSIMGGAIGGGFTNALLGKVDGEERVGNRTRWAEFNIHCDPESASTIFSNPTLASKTTLIPLDLTHLVLATPPILDTLLRGPHGSHRLRQLLHDLLTFYSYTYATVFGLTAGPPLHDPVAVAAVLQSSGGLEFDDSDGERFSVDVVTGNCERVGMVSVKSVGKGEGVRIPKGLNVARFWRIIDECVERAEGALI